MKRIALAGIVAAFVAASAQAADAPSAAASDWRDVDPQNLVLLDTRYGQVAIELAPGFAPINAAMDSSDRIGVGAPLLIPGIRLYSFA